MHFQKHGHEFGVTDEHAYEQLADLFMFGPMTPNTRECFRPPNQRNKVRLECAVLHFGAACIRPEFVKTFYSIRPAKISNRGGIAGFLAVECGRVDP